MARVGNQIFQGDRFHLIAARQLDIGVLHVCGRASYCRHCVKHAFARRGQRHAHAVARADNGYCCRVVLHNPDNGLRLVGHFFQTAFNQVLNLNRRFSDHRNVADKRNGNRPFRADHLVGQLGLLRAAGTGGRERAAEQHGRRGFPNGNVQHIPRMDKAARSRTVAKLGEGLVVLGLVECLGNGVIDINQFYRRYCRLAPLCTYRSYLSGTWPRRWYKSTGGQKEKYGEI